MTNNKLKAVVTVLGLSLGVVFAAVAIRIQTDPLAYTTKKTVTNITSAPERVITLDPVVIVGEIEKPGTAMAKRPVTVVNKKVEVKPAKSKDCKLTYRVVGFGDSKFETFRGVYYCEP